MTHLPHTLRAASGTAPAWLAWGGPVAAVFLALAVTLAPGASGSLVAGPSLTLVGKALLAAVWTSGCALVLFRTPQVPRALILALVAVLVGKVGVATFDEPSGWMRRVVLDNGQPITAFWGFGARTYRIDPVIRFAGSRFGLHDLNSIRFSDGAYVDGARDVTLGWRAEWTGYAPTSPGVSVTVRLTAAGRVTLRADGVPFADVVDPADVVVSVVPASDRTRLDVVYQKPAGVRPAIDVRLDGDAANHVAPFSHASANPRPQELRRVLTTGAVLAVVGWFVLWTLWNACGLAAPRWPSARLATLAVVAGVAIVAAGAVTISDRHADQTYHMSSGNDPLVYEGNARDVMANGVLMLAGRPLGQARPYFHYPLYPYVVALMHWGIGDDAASVMLGNGLLIATVLPLLWMLGWYRLGPVAAIAAIAIATWFLVWHGLPYAVEVFTDNLFLPLVIASIAVGTWAARSNRAVAWIATGIAIALGAAARPSLLTNLPVLIGLLLVLGRWRGMGWALRAAAFVTCGFVLGVAPFTLRNFVASGQVVLLVNSWVGIPVFLVPPGESYAFLGFDGTPISLGQSLAKAYGLFEAHPWRTVLLEVRKVLFTLGFTNLAHGQPLYYEFVAITAGGLLAVVRRRLEPAVLLASGAFALSHLLAMVMAAPWTYGYKSILPVQMVFLFWAAFLLSGDARRNVE